MAFPWSLLIKLILENIQNRSGNKWAGVRAHHKTTTVQPRRQKLFFFFFFLKTERFSFRTISRYCYLFKWKDDCKSDYLLSERQHSCSIQKLQRAFFDPVNMEMRAQRVLSLKKNSCINKSYLWKRWNIFSTKLYLSSLSWKCWKPFKRYCRILLLMSDHVQPWKWFAHIFHVPASHRAPPDLLGEISD